MAKRASDAGRPAANGKETAERPQAGRDPGAGAPDQASLKGTFASVMLLGAFLIVAWVSVFVLYVHRN
ncbi:hypothetical protein J19TS2_24320 [Cohnella xylanilytica]|uniref:Cytochrome c oxidase subunit 2A n=1 Tax=Cohnella xylanilytica TaxID=557555 RepID=A0A841TX35_9BACL|nr:cytochrome c oxidase subunit 2A [Cohnella xylanilytica]MBB6691558.1 cytochrome c oxidase subunit 2A [Cohnella xylanilytica]GIO12877.1 hypothetical protein J19TS2_24320 [Cohnella xylanilytica]